MGNDTTGLLGARVVGRSQRPAFIAMSVSSDHPRLRECQHRECDALRPATSLLGGQYCSDECRREAHTFAAEYGPDVYPCSHCGGPRRPVESVRGSFCSTACWFRHKGAKVLDQIASDHRWCATCFRQLKTVERPRPTERVEVEGPDHPGRADSGPKDVLIGWEYTTDDATRAVDDFAREEHNELLRERWGCVCGTVNPRERDAILEQVDTERTITSLRHCLVHLHAEGIVDAPDRERFYAALGEHYLDWEYAIGRALFDDP